MRHTKTSPQQYGTQCGTQAVRHMKMTKSWEVVGLLEFICTVLVPSRACVRPFTPLAAGHLVMVMALDNMALVWYDAIKIREVERMTT